MASVSTCASATNVVAVARPEAKVERMEEDDDSIDYRSDTAVELPHGTNDNDDANIDY